MWGLSQAAKTLDFHSRSRGSIPLAPTMPIIRQFFIGYPGHDIKLSTLIAVSPNRLRHQPLKLTFSGSSPDTATTPPHRGYRQTHPGYDVKLSVHSGVLSNGQDCAL